MDIPLSNLSFATPQTVRLVAKYIKENKTKRDKIKAPLREATLDKEKHCSESDIQLLKHCKYTRDLTNLINMADYLDIESLFTLACGKVASILRGQPKSVVEQRLDPDYIINT